MAQLLRLDNEAVDESLEDLSTSGKITNREARRRVMWSCYILDVIVGSGIDSFVMSTRSLPRIQLPCSSQSFTLQMASETGPLIPNNNPMEAAEQNLGLEAVFVRVIYLRSQVLR